MLSIIHIHCISCTSQSSYWKKASSTWPHCLSLSCLQLYSFIYLYSEHIHGTINVITLPLTSYTPQAIIKCAALFVNHSKAFETVDNGSLLQTFVTIEWIKLFHNYLNGRHQCVKAGIGKANLLQISKGVPQGLTLRSILFRLYINDLSFALNEFAFCYEWLCQDPKAGITQWRISFPRSFYKSLQEFLKTKIRGDHDKVLIKSTKKTLTTIFPSKVKNQSVKKNTNDDPEMGSKLIQEEKVTTIILQREVWVSLGNKNIPTLANREYSP